MRGVSAPFVAGAWRLEQAVLVRGDVDDRRARREHAADEFRRVERTERGGVAADLLIGPQPRARRDIAADALAIARVLEAAQSLALAVALRGVGGRSVERSNSPALTSSDGAPMRKANSGAQAKLMAPLTLRRLPS